jgi:hypothetical protein
MQQAALTTSILFQELFGAAMQINFKHDNMTRLDAA